MAGEVVMQIKGSVRSFDEHGRKVIDGVHFHHEPHVNHDPDHASIGFRIDQPISNDGRLGRILTEDA